MRRLSSFRVQMSNRRRTNGFGAKIRFLVRFFTFGLTDRLRFPSRRMGRSHVSNPRQYQTKNISAFGANSPQSDLLNSTNSSHLFNEEAPSKGMRCKLQDRSDSNGSLAAQWIRLYWWSFPEIGQISILCKCAEGLMTRY